MADPDVANPLGALLLLGATVFLLAGMYVVCYTFFMARVVEEERLRRRGLK